MLVILHIDICAIYKLDSSEMKQGGASAGFFEVPIKFPHLKDAAMWKKQMRTMQKRGRMYMEHVVVVHLSFQVIIDVYMYIPNDSSTLFNLLY